MSTAGNNATIPVRKGEELDWPALDRLLKSVVLGLEGEVEVSQFPGGKSNLTYRLEYTNQDLVLRRPPFGTKAKSAHSMIREYRIMTELKPVYPSVPDTLYYSDDESVIGSEFYVMRMVEGSLIGNRIPPAWEFSPADTRKFCICFWDKLIELHQVDYVAAGLGDFGKAEGYVERQILGWNRRYEKAITPDADRFSAVRNWLEDNLPGATHNHSILHGDYRIDNVVVNENDPCEIKAVLDWEICALGDPLMDLGNSLAYWVQADDPAGLKQLIVQPSDAPGMLTRREILELYQDRTGHDTSNFTFYMTYGYWRLAVILQQIYFRYYHGQTQDKRFSGFGAMTRQLGEHCKRLISNS